MPAFKGIYFGGRPILKPGAYSRIDASGLRPNRLSPANTLMVIGDSKGGDPGVVHTFNSPSDARNVLRDGTALRMIEMAYNPSPTIPGAGEVKFIRIGAALQSSISLEASATPVVTFTSKDYGVLQNNLRIKVESGTVSGKRITVEDISEDRPAIEVADNLGNTFEIQYTGTGTTCVLDITKTGDDATLLATTTGTPSVPTDDLSLDLTLLQYNTLGKVIGAINNHPNYTCSLAGSADGSMPSSKLDAATAQDIETAAYTHTAAIGAIEHWFDRFSVLATAARITSETDAPDNIAFTHFASGSEGAAPDLARWQNRLTLAESEDVRVIVPDTEDVAIMGAVLDHCETMSDVLNRRERRTFVGGALALTPQDAIDEAREVSSPRCTYVYPGVVDRDPATGDKETLAPRYHAAMLAGMNMGTPASTSITNKSIRVAGLEREFSRAETDLLLDGGVTFSEFVHNRGIYRIVQGLTTYLDDANVAYRKIIGMDVQDFVSVELRNTAEDFIGETGDLATIESLRNALVSKLDTLERSPANPAGVLTPGVDEFGAAQPSWRNLVVDYDGLELVTVTVDVAPVGEIAYITITATLVVNRIQLAAA